MTLERVDVTLRFLSGPLSWEADLTRRGPTVRVGANPGPEGLKLEGYRGIDDRHAVITAYTESEVTIAPVGPNQVRVAPHEHVDWSEIHPIRGPVHLSAGCAVHLGPVGRGGTLTFVKAERLSAEGRVGTVLSEGAQFENPESSQAVDVTSGRRVPWWFWAGIGCLVPGFLSSLLVVVAIVVTREPEPLGPIDTSDLADPTTNTEEAYGKVFEVTQVNSSITDRVDRAYAAFVMGPNLKAAPAFAGLDSHPEKWDRKLVDYVARSEQLYLKYWQFWGDLERARADYADVVKKLRDAGLPEVLAAIPYQESRYHATARDAMLCAMGMWQFQPETGHRYGLRIEGCTLRGTNITDWTPTAIVTPIHAAKNAVYVSDNRCIITSCTTDERTSVDRSTDAAVKSLAEAYGDADLRSSGAVVQMTIASHNCGYDDSRFGKNSVTNIKPAYARYKKWKSKNDGITMLGDSITCSSKSQMKAGEDYNSLCNSVIPNVTQTYVPQVIAYHLLAVCYYATNYPDDPVFSGWRRYLQNDEYCHALNIPDKAKVAQMAGKAR